MASDEGLYASIKNRERKKSSRLLEAEADSEDLAPPAPKKARHESSSTATSKKPTPSANPSAARQQLPLPFTSSARSTSSRASSPPTSRATSVGIEDEMDMDAGVETRGPVPLRADRELEAADGSDDDVESLVPPPTAGARGKHQAPLPPKPKAKAKPPMKPPPKKVVDDNDSSSEEEAAPMDPQMKLDLLAKKWTSPVYVFFKSPIYKEENGIRYQVFECAAKQCKNSGNRNVRRNMDTKDSTSTSNLHGHTNACFGEDVVKAAMATKSLAKAREVVKDKNNLKDGSIRVAFERVGAEQVTYSAAIPTATQSRVNHVKWMTESKRPFALVDDPGYRRNMKEGRPTVYIPSQSTLSRDVKKVFAGARERISKLLREHTGALHFATDCWTSPNRKAYMAVTVRYEVKGKIDEWLLDIVEVARRHSGVTLAAEFANIIEDFGLVSRLLSITCDNATNNDVMIAEYQQLNKYFHAQSIIAQFDVKERKSKGKKGGDDFGELDDDDAELARLEAELEAMAGEIDEEEDDIERETPEDEREKEDKDDGWVNPQDDLGAEEVKELKKTVMPAKKMLAKLRKISFALKNSPTVILLRWKVLCKKHDLPDNIIPRDVKTRWNSTYDMLVFAYDYRKVIDDLTNDRETKLRAYEFDAEGEEWKLAKQLRDILKTFKTTTLEFSQAEESNISLVIPAMDRFDEKLTTASISPKYAPGIRAAVTLGRKTLNRYYSKTDQSAIYRIAMILDPRFKLTYFQQLKWEQEWIDKSITLVRDQLLAYDTPNPADDDDFIMDIDNTPEARASPEDDEGSFRSYLNRSWGNVTGPDGEGDELERYLSQPTVKLEDPLVWWAQAENRRKYPTLACIARDYLGAHASSVNVERVFSEGRQVLSYLQNRLSVQTTWSILCLGDWIRHGIILEKHMHGYLAGTPVLQEDEEEDEEDVAEGWDAIRKPY